MVTPRQPNLSPQPSVEQPGMAQGYTMPGTASGYSPFTQARINPEYAAQYEAQANLLRAGLPQLPGMAAGPLPALVPLDSPEMLNEAIRLANDKLKELYMRVRSSFEYHLSGWVQMYEAKEFSQGQPSVLKPEQRLMWFMAHEPVLAGDQMSLVSWLLQPAAELLAPYWGKLYAFRPKLCLSMLQDYRHLLLNKGVYAAGS